MSALAVLMSLICGGAFAGELKLAVPAQSQLQFDQIPGFYLGGQTRKESFWNSKNVILGVGLVVGSTADLETTFSSIGRTHLSTRVLSDGSTQTVQYQLIESHSWMRPFVGSGRPAAYGVKLIADAGALYIGHKMRQSEHKIVRIAGWVVPVAVVSLQGYMAISNVKTRHDFDRLP